MNTLEKSVRRWIAWLLPGRFPGLWPFQVQPTAGADTLAPALVRSR